MSKELKSLVNNITEELEIPKDTIEIMESLITKYGLIKFIQPERGDTLYYDGKIFEYDGPVSDIIIIPCSGIK